MGFFSNLFGGDDARAISESARIQQEANQQAIAEQRRQYNQTREDFAPYREAGGQGVDALRALLIDGTGFRESPDYQFRVGEGVKALERGAAARGRTYSGAQGRALTNYGQQAGSQEFGNRVNRLAALSGIGQSAVGSTAGFGAQTSGNIANLLSANGQIAGNSVIDQQGARNQATNNLLSLAGQGAGMLAGTSFTTGSGANAVTGSLMQRGLGSFFG